MTSIKNPSMHEATFPERLRDLSRSVPLETIVGLFSIDWDESRHVDIPPIEPQNADLELLKLNQDLIALKKHKDPALHQIHGLAKRTCIAQDAHEQRLNQIAMQQQVLSKHHAAVWNEFNLLLSHDWDDELFVVCSKLSTINSKLLLLRDIALSETLPQDFDDQLNYIREELGDFVEQHTFEGKFVYSDEPDIFPKGQALCVSLLNQSIRLLRELLKKSLKGNFDFTSSGSIDVGNL